MATTNRSESAPETVDIRAVGQETALEPYLVEAATEEIVEPEFESQEYWNYGWGQLAPRWKPEYVVGGYGPEFIPAQTEWQYPDYVVSVDAIPDYVAPPAFDVIMPYKEEMITVSDVSDVRKRRRDKCCCTWCCILLSLLLLAMGLVPLILHLLTSSSGSTKEVPIGRVSTEVTVSNISFVEDMLNTSSTEFKQVANKFEREMGRLLENSPLKTPFAGIRVNSIRNETGLPVVEFDIFFNIVDSRIPSYSEIKDAFNTTGQVQNSKDVSVLDEIQFRKDSLKFLESAIEKRVTDIFEKGYTGVDVSGSSIKAKDTKTTEESASTNIAKDNAIKIFDTKKVVQSSSDSKSTSVKEDLSTVSDLERFTNSKSIKLSDKSVADNINKTPVEIRMNAKKNKTSFDISGLVNISLVFLNEELKSKSGLEKSVKPADEINKVEQPETLTKESIDKITNDVMAAVRLLVDQKEKESLKTDVISREGGSSFEGKTNVTSKDMDISKESYIQNIKNINMFFGNEPMPLNATHHIMKIGNNRFALLPQDSELLKLAMKSRDKSSATQSDTQLTQLVGDKLKASEEVNITGMINNGTFSGDISTEQKSLKSDSKSVINNWHFTYILGMPPTFNGTRPKPAYYWPDNLDRFFNMTRAGQGFLSLTREKDIGLPSRVGTVGPQEQDQPKGMETSTEFISRTSVPSSLTANITTKSPSATATPLNRTIVTKMGSKAKLNTDEIKKLIAAIEYILLKNTTAVDAVVTEMYKHSQQMKVSSENEPSEMLNLISKMSNLNVTDQARKIVTYIVSVYYIKKNPEVKNNPFYRGLMSDEVFKSIVDIAESPPLVGLSADFFDDYSLNYTFHHTLDLLGNTTDYAHTNRSDQKYEYININVDLSEFKDSQEANVKEKKSLHSEEPQLSYDVSFLNDTVWNKWLANNQDTLKRIMSNDILLDASSVFQNLTNLGNSDDLVRTVLARYIVYMYYRQIEGMESKNEDVTVILSEIPRLNQTYAFPIDLANAGSLMKTLRYLTIQEIRSLIFHILQGNVLNTDTHERISTLLQMTNTDGNTIQDLWLLFLNDMRQGSPLQRTFQDQLPYKRFLVYLFLLRNNMINRLNISTTTLENVHRLGGDLTRRRIFQTQLDAFDTELQNNDKLFRLIEYLLAFLNLAPRKSTTGTVETTTAAEETTTASTTYAEETTTAATTVAKIAEISTTAATTVAEETTTTASTTVAEEITTASTTVAEETTTASTTDVEETTRAATTVAERNTTTASTTVAEETTTASTTVAEETTTVSTTVAEENTTAATSVANETTTVSTSVAEETTTAATTVADETTTKATTVANETTTKATTVAEETTTKATTTAEETTTKATTVAEETTTASITVAEETTTVSTTVAEYTTTSASTTVAEETTTASTTVAEETTRAATTVAEETTSTASTTVTEETTTAATTVAEETTTVSTTVAEATTTAATTVADETTTVSTTVAEETTIKATTTAEETTTAATTVAEETTTASITVAEYTTTSASTTVSEETTTAATTVAEENTTTATTVADETTKAATTVAEETTISASTTVTEETTTTPTTVAEETTTTSLTTVADKTITKASTTFSEETTTAATTVAEETTTTASTTVAEETTTTATTVEEETTTAATTVAEKTTTTASTTVEEKTTTTASTTVAEETTRAATTVAEESTLESTTVAEETTTTAATTVAEETTTTSSATVAEENITAATTVPEETTTAASSIAENTTLATTVAEETTTTSTTVAEETTTTAATTVAEETTTTATTVAEETSTTASTTVAEETTTTATTVAEETTTASTTVAEETTTTPATTVAEETTTIAPTTVAEETTTTASTTVEEETTTTAATKVAEKTTTTASTTVAEETTTTTATTVAEETTTTATTVAEETTTASTTVEEETTTASSTVAAETTTASTTVAVETTTTPATTAAEETTTTAATVEEETTTTASTSVAEESTTTAATVAEETTTTASTTVAEVTTTTASTTVAEETTTTASTTVAEETTTTASTTVAEETTPTPATTVAEETTTTASTKIAEETTTTASTTVAEETTTTTSTTIAEVTTPTASTTVAEETTTTAATKVAEERTSTTATTVAEETTTTAATTVADETTTTASTTVAEETTTAPATIVAEETTTTATTVAEETSTTSTTVAEETTTTTATAVAEETTTTASTTVAEETTTTASTTVAEETSTTPATTVAEETTTTATTVAEETSTKATTVAEETTTTASTTVAEETTTTASTTVAEETTTTPATTVAEETTPASTTFVDETTTASTRVAEETTTASTTVAEETTTTASTPVAEETTTPATTVAEETTKAATTVAEETTTTASSTVAEETTTASTTVVDETTTASTTVAEETTTTTSTTVAEETTTTASTTVAEETPTTASTTVSEETTTTASTTVAAGTTTTASTTVAEEITTTAITVADETTTTATTAAEETTTTAATTVAEETTTTAITVADETTTAATTAAEETTTTAATTVAEETTTTASTTVAEETTPASTTFVDETTTASTTVAEETTTTTSTTVAEETTTTASTTVAEETITTSSTTVAVETTTTASTTVAAGTTTTASTTVAEETTTTAATTVAEETTTTAATTVAETTNVPTTVAEENTTTASTTVAEKTTTTALTTFAEETTPTASTTVAEEITTTATTAAEETTTTASTTVAGETTTTASTTVAGETTTTAATTVAEETTTKAASTFAEETTTSAAATVAEVTTPTASTTVAEETTTTAATKVAEERTSTTATTVSEETTTASTTVAEETTTTAATTVAEETTTASTTVAEETTTTAATTVAEETTTTVATTVAEETTTASTAVAEETTTTVAATVAEETTTSAATPVAEETTTVVAEDTIPAASTLTVNTTTKATTVPDKTPTTATTIGQDTTSVSTIISKEVTTAYFMRTTRQHTAESEITQTPKLDINTTHPFQFTPSTKLILSLFEQNGTSISQWIAENEQLIGDSLKNDTQINVNDLHSIMNTTDLDSTSEKRKLIRYIIYFYFTKDKQGKNITDQVMPWLSGIYGPNGNLTLSKVIQKAFDTFSVNISNDSKNSFESDAALKRPFSIRHEEAASVDIKSLHPAWSLTNEQETDALRKVFIQVGGNESQLRQLLNETGLTIDEMNELNGKDPIQIDSRKKIIRYLIYLYMLRNHPDHLNKTVLQNVTITTIIEGLARNYSQTNETSDFLQYITNSINEQFWNGGIPTRAPVVTTGSAITLSEETINSSMTVPVKTYITSTTVGKGNSSSTTATTIATTAKTIQDEAIPRQLSTTASNAAERTLSISTPVARETTSIASPVLKETSTSSKAVAAITISNASTTTSTEYTSEIKTLVKTTPTVTTTGYQKTTQKFIPGFKYLWSLGESELSTLLSKSTTIKQPDTDWQHGDFSDVRGSSNQQNTSNAGTDVPGSFKTFNGSSVKPKTIDLMSNQTVFTWTMPTSGVNVTKIPPVRTQSRQGPEVHLSNFTSYGEHLAATNDDEFYNYIFNIHEHIKNTSHFDDWVNSNRKEILTFTEHDQSLDMPSMVNNMLGSDDTDLRRIFNYLIYIYFTEGRKNKPFDVSNTFSDGHAILESGNAPATNIRDIQVAQSLFEKDTGKQILKRLTGNNARRFLQRSTRQTHAAVDQNITNSPPPGSLTNHTAHEDVIDKLGMLDQWMTTDKESILKIIQNTGTNTSDFLTLLSHLITIQPDLNYQDIITYFSRFYFVNGSTSNSQISNGTTLPSIHDLIMKYPGLKDLKVPQDKNLTLESIQKHIQNLENVSTMENVAPKHEGHPHFIKDDSKGNENITEIERIQIETHQLMDNGTIGGIWINIDLQNIWNKLQSEAPQNMTASILRIMNTLPTIDDSHLERTRKKILSYLIYVYLMKQKRDSASGAETKVRNQIDKDKQFPAETKNGSMTDDDRMIYGFDKLLQNNTISSLIQYIMGLNEYSLTDFGRNPLDSKNLPIDGIGAKTAFIVHKPTYKPDLAETSFNATTRRSHATIIGNWITQNRAAINKRLENDPDALDVLEILSNEKKNKSAQHQRNLLNYLIYLYFLNDSQIRKMFYKETVLPEFRLLVPNFSTEKGFDMKLYQNNTLGYVLNYVLDMLNMSRSENVTLNNWTFGMNITSTTIVPTTPENVTFTEASQELSIHDLGYDANTINIWFNNNLPNIWKNLSKSQNMTISLPKLMNVFSSSNDDPVQQKRKKILTYLLYVYFLRPNRGQSALSGSNMENQIGRLIYGDDHLLQNNSIPSILQYVMNLNETGLSKINLIQIFDNITYSEMIEGSSQNATLAPDLASGLLNSTNLNSLVDDWISHHEAEILKILSADPDSSVVLRMLSREDTSDLARRQNKLMNYLIYLYFLNDKQGRGRIYKEIVLPELMLLMPNYSHGKGFDLKIYENNTLGFVLNYVLDMLNMSRSENVTLNNWTFGINISSTTIVPITAENVTSTEASRQLSIHDLGYDANSMNIWFDKNLPNIWKHLSKSQNMTISLPKLMNVFSSSNDDPMQQKRKNILTYLLYVYFLRPNREQSAISGSNVENQIGRLIYGDDHLLQNYSIPSVLKYVMNLNETSLRKINLIKIYDNITSSEMIERISQNATLAPELVTGLLNSTIVDSHVDDWISRHETEILKILSADPDSSEVLRMLSREDTSQQTKRQHKLMNYLIYLYFLNDKPGRDKIYKEIVLPEIKLLIPNNYTGKEFDLKLYQNRSLGYILNYVLRIFKKMPLDNEPVNYVTISPNMSSTNITSTASTNETGTGAASLNISDFDHNVNKWLKSNLLSIWEHLYEEKSPNMTISVPELMHVLSTSYDDPTEQKRKSILSYLIYVYFLRQRNRNISDSVVAERNPSVQMQMFPRFEGILVNKTLSRVIEYVFDLNENGLNMLYSPHNISFSGDSKEIHTETGRLTESEGVSSKAVPDILNRTIVKYPAMHIGQWVKDNKAAIMEVLQNGTLSTNALQLLSRKDNTELDIKQRRAINYLIYLYFLNDKALRKKLYTDIVQPELNILMPQYSTWNQRFDLKLYDNSSLGYILNLVPKMFKVTINNAAMNNATFMNKISPVNEIVNSSSMDGSVGSSTKGFHVNVNNWGDNNSSHIWDYLSQDISHNMTSSLYNIRDFLSTPTDEPLEQKRKRILNYLIYTYFLRLSRRDTPTDVMRFKNETAVGRLMHRFNEMLQERPISGLLQYVMKLNGTELNNLEHSPLHINVTIDRFDTSVKGVPIRYNDSSTSQVDRTAMNETLDIESWITNNKNAITEILERDPHASNVSTILFQEDASELANGKRKLISYLIYLYFRNDTGNRGKSSNESIFPEMAHLTPQLSAFLYQNNSFTYILNEIANIDNVNPIANATLENQILDALITNHTKTQNVPINAFTLKSLLYNVNDNATNVNSWLSYNLPNVWEQLSKEKSKDMTISLPEIMNILSTSSSDPTVQRRKKLLSYLIYVYFLQQNRKDITKGAIDVNNHTDAVRMLHGVKRILKNNSLSSIIQYAVNLTDNELNAMTDVNVPGKNHTVQSATTNPIHHDINFNDNLISSKTLLSLDDLKSNPLWNEWFFKNQNVISKILTKNNTFDSRTISTLYSELTAGLGDTPSNERTNLLRYLVYIYYLRANPPLSSENNEIRDKIKLKDIGLHYEGLPFNVMYLRNETFTTELNKMFDQVLHNDSYITTLTRTTSMVTDVPVGNTINHTGGHNIVSKQSGDDWMTWTKKFFKGTKDDTPKFPQRGVITRSNFSNEMHSPGQTRGEGMQMFVLNVTRVVDASDKSTDVNPLALLLNASTSGNISGSIDPIILDIIKRKSGQVSFNETGRNMVWTSTGQDGWLGINVSSSIISNTVNESSGIRTVVKVVQEEERGTVQHRTVPSSVSQSTTTTTQMPTIEAASGRTDSLSFETTANITDVLNNTFLLSATEVNMSAAEILFHQSGDAYLGESVSLTWKLNNISGWRFIVVQKEYPNSDADLIAVVMENYRVPVSPAHSPVTISSSSEFFENNATVSIDFTNVTCNDSAVYDVRVLDVIDQVVFMQKHIHVFGRPSASVVSPSFLIDGHGVDQLQCQADLGHPRGRMFMRVKYNDRKNFITRVTPPAKINIEDIGRCRSNATAPFKSVLNSGFDIESLQIQCGVFNTRAIKTKSGVVMSDIRTIRIIPADICPAGFVGVVNNPLDVCGFVDCSTHTVHECPLKTCFSNVTGACFPTFEQTSTARHTTTTRKMKKPNTVTSSIATVDQTETNTLHEEMKVPIQ